MDEMIGVDIGGTHLRVGRISLQGKILQVVRRSLAEKSPQAILQQLDRALLELGEPAVGLPIGIGIAGQLWLGKGIVAVAPNLGWRQVPFGDMLTAQFGPRVRMVNDLNAIAAGEAKFGAGGGVEDFVCVFVGTGVGMGAVVDGILQEGADGLATEIGHIKVESPSQGRACGCGERGCLEAYTGGIHLPEQFVALVKQGLPSPLWQAIDQQQSNITAALIDEYATKGDGAAQALWEQNSTYLASAIGTAVTLYNPRVLVLGGGVLVFAPHLRAKIVEKIPAYTARPAMTNVQIKTTSLGDDSGMLGAAWLAHTVFRASRISTHERL